MSILSNKKIKKASYLSIKGEMEQDKGRIEIKYPVLMIGRLSLSIRNRRKKKILWLSIWRDSTAARNRTNAAIRATLSIPALSRNSKLSRSTLRSPRVGTIKK